MPQMVSTTNNMVNFGEAFHSCGTAAKKRETVFAPHVIILTGHYGSGKTSLAKQFALRMGAEGKRVSLCDLDIVNPYFRSSDYRNALEKAGIRVICSKYAGGNLDIPALPKELGEALTAKDGVTILDVGGDDRGALALGRYAPDIGRANGYEMLFAVNFYRPRTRTPEDALAVLREVETASGIKATALMNNSNLGMETMAEDVLDTQSSIEALSRLANLPTAGTAAARRLKNELEGRIDRPFWLDLGEDRDYGETNV